MVAVFQPRALEGQLGIDEAHLSELEYAIGNPENPKLLDAITVWWGGDRYYVIDGHHRLIAYERKGFRGGIPVEVFEGSLDQAMAQSGALNSKNRLPMRQEDKLNYAWRLVLASSLSKREIAEACAVSNGSVGNMRTVRSDLLGMPDTTLEDLYQMTWTQARLTSAGTASDTPFDADAALRKRAERFAKSIARAVKDRPMVDPEAFAMALQLLDKRLPSLLMQTNAWGDPFIETVEALRAELASADGLAAAWENGDDY
jgi:ParB-like chromosome segregation protein Spo0J